MSDILTLLVIGVAMGYIAWRVYRLFVGKGNSGCASGCSSCPQATAEEITGGSRTFVSVDQLSQIGSEKQSAFTWPRLSETRSESRRDSPT